MSDTVSLLRRCSTSRSSESGLLVGASAGLVESGEAVVEALETGVYETVRDGECVAMRGDAPLDIVFWPSMFEWFEIGEPGGGLQLHR